MKLKAEGKTVKDHPVIDQLVRIRTILEKMKPIEAKLKHQIEQLLKIAETGLSGMQPHYTHFGTNCSVQIHLLPYQGPILVRCKIWRRTIQMSLMVRLPCGNSPESKLIFIVDGLYKAPKHMVMEIQEKQKGVLFFTLLVGY